MPKKTSKKTAVNPVMVAMEKGFAVLHEELKNIQRKQVESDAKIKSMT